MMAPGPMGPPMGAPMGPMSGAPPSGHSNRPMQGSAKTGPVLRPLNEIRAEQRRAARSQALSGNF